MKELARTTRNWSNDIFLLHLLDLIFYLNAVNDLLLTIVQSNVIVTSTMQMRRMAARLLVLRVSMSVAVSVSSNGNNTRYEKEPKEAQVVSQLLPTRIGSRRPSVRPGFFGSATRSVKAVVDIQAAPCVGGCRMNCMFLSFVN